MKQTTKTSKLNFPIITTPSPTRGFTLALWCSSLHWRAAGIFLACGCEKSPCSECLEKINF